MLGVGNGLLGSPALALDRNREAIGVEPVDHLLCPCRRLLIPSISPSDFRIACFPQAREKAVEGNLLCPSSAAIFKTEDFVHDFLRVIRLIGSGSHAVQTKLTPSSL